MPTDRAVSRETRRGLAPRQMDMLIKALVTLCLEERGYDVPAHVANTAYQKLTTWLAALDTTEKEEF